MLGVITYSDQLNSITFLLVRDVTSGRIFQKGFLQENTALSYLHRNIKSHCLHHTLTDSLRRWSSIFHLFTIFEHKPFIEILLFFLSKKCSLPLLKDSPNNWVFLNIFTCFSGKLNKYWRHLRDINQPFVEFPKLVFCIFLLSNWSECLL